MMVPCVLAGMRHAGHGIPQSDIAFFYRISCVLTNRIVYYSIPAIFDLKVPPLVVP
jgi:hypothetical protein